MADFANYAEVRRALGEQTSGILQQIPAASAQLSMPLDSRGARIKAGVKPADEGQVPSNVGVELDGRRLTIPVEATDDHQELKAYGPSRNPCGPGPASRAAALRRATR